ncbi:Sporulation related domain-containing protein [Aquiflexum balticum DSM 16537]|uniref:Sporulation related domain-containing protein n=1 Tax=Aquiflexum balticum DSM 16537 TaxID=758820 RepID=A0A1W2H7M0_9BACT|nr:SPOR domain-containing protein [Aquiflexum balticum]SMD44506.1 Sporulation related domain-containing protein [Aquiflexum balticum DSM 16537]
MIDKEDGTTKNSDDKDYGFPFVAVKPLGSAISFDEKVSRKEEEKIPDEVQPPKMEAEAIIPEAAPIKFNTEDRGIRKRKSQLPLLISLVFLIVIILASLAYFLYYLPENNNAIQESPQIAETIESEEPEEPIDIVAEDPDELLEAENEGTESASEQAIPESQPIVESKGAQLFVVDKRGEVPYYNLIVASSPNERIARAEAQKLIDKGSDVWIIFPFGNTNNYRISVGRYGDLESATKALESVKVEINESSWILKY